MSKILIIDDEEKLRSLLSRIVELEGFEVLQAGDCKTGLKLLERYEIDVVLCDVKLPDGNGVELTSQIKSGFPMVEVVLLTAYGNIPDGIQAIKNGAFDYITKGDDNNKIIPLLFRALEKVQLAKRVKHLEKQLGGRYAFDQLVGKSAKYRAAIGLAQKVASDDIPVLLNGETGTGKEIFAQAIHQSGTRKNGNFVAVNCSAFTRDLLESEMFGHRAGAFTGALKDKKGLFEEAHQGTLFLDEIGEMPQELQAKLLRVLETGEFIKLGDTKTTRVNVRIIAATNRDLTEEIRAGHFRADLFYRIAAFQITLPALRERLDDIESLTRFFAEVYAQKTNRRLTKISEAYFRSLNQYGWPGNIRELKNVIERSIILMETDTLEPETLPLEIVGASAQTSSGSFSFDLASVEKLHIRKVLNHTNGNKTEAARLLNIALTTLYRKIEEYHLT